MTIHQCPTCSKEFARAAYLESHLARKVPCTPHEQADKVFECDNCDKCYKNATHLSRHRKSCQGRKATVESLTAEIEVLREQLSANEEISAQISVQSIQSFELKPLNVTGIADIFKPQVYLGRPGELLIAAGNVEGFLVKLGSSRHMVDRCETHRRDYGGFTLLDSVVTLFPEVVEDRLKQVLKIQGRLISCRTPKKSCNDTEILVIKTQEDYVELVLLVQDIARNYENEVKVNEQNEMCSQNEKLTSAILLLQEKIDNLT